MKSTSLFAVTLLTLPMTAAALDGAGWRKLWNDENTFGKVHAHGFVQGASDTYISIASDPQRNLLQVCPPDGAQIEQAVLIFSAFLEKNPARWQEPAARLLADALIEAWPCPAADDE